ncbi:hypothetical protein SUGI_0596670 [Cryptomeria japonica]|nr:hypothetical protein SUGI_0596670 [Cryptomeria japonica]
MSTFTIDVNLWGVAWEQLGEDLKNMYVAQTVVILEVTNARVGYFNGKMINTTTTTTLKINPSTPEADALISRGNIPADLLPLLCCWSTKLPIQQDDNRIYLGTNDCPLSNN